MENMLRITADGLFEKCLLFIRDTLADSGTSAEIDGDGVNIKYTIDNEAFVQSIVRDTVAQVVAVDMKSHYINTEIKLEVGDALKRFAFIRALCSFDHEDDIAIARGILNLTPILNLDGFYNFCIAKLKKRWDEVCVLANGNLSSLAVGGAFDELLQFLYMNIEGSEEYLFLKCYDEGGSVVVLDRTMKRMPEYIGSGMCEAECVIAQIIMTAPRKVFILGTSDLFYEIEDLFEGLVLFERLIIPINVHQEIRKNSRF